MTISTKQIAERLFKEAYGVSETNYDLESRGLLEEPIPTYAAVVPSDIWREANLIPSTPPILTNSQTSGVVQYFEKLLLEAIDGTTVSFKSNNLKDAISTKFGFGYKYKVYNSSGTIQIYSGNWVVDAEAGVIVFYSTPTEAAVNSQNPPKITFYKYIGEKGFPTQTSSDWSSITNKPDPVITLTGDVTGSVTLTDLTSGTISSTISDNTVTNAKLANMASFTIKGRKDSTSGAPQDLNVTQTKLVLGLNNVDNTSDADKPVSTATLLALALKSDTAHTHDIAIPNQGLIDGENGFMSAADKEKLDGIQGFAEVNVRANWTATEEDGDSFILNKPAIVGDMTRAIYDTNLDGKVNSAVIADESFAIIDASNNRHTIDTLNTALSLKGDMFKSSYDTNGLTGNIVDKAAILTDGGLISYDALLLKTTLDGIDSTINTHSSQIATNTSNIHNKELAGLSDVYFPVFPEGLPDGSTIKYNNATGKWNYTNIKTINNTSILGSGNISTLTTEADPVFLNSQASSITASHISILNNTTGINTGDEVIEISTITGNEGIPNRIYVALDTQKIYRYNNGWIELSPKGAPEVSLSGNNTFTGANIYNPGASISTQGASITIVSGDLILEEANNIVAGNGALITPIELAQLDGIDTGLTIQSQLDLKSPKVSPAFSGTPTFSGTSTFTGTVVLPLTTSIGNVSNTELAQLDGISTSSTIQGQLNTINTTLSDKVSKTSANTNITASNTFTIGTNTFSSTSSVLINLLTLLKFSKTNISTTSQIGSTGNFFGLTAGITVTLPAASTNTGRILIIISDDSWYKTITGLNNGNINGNSAGLALNIQYDLLVLISNGTTWVKLIYINNGLIGGESPL